jgi:DNA polymerase III psi subunit
MQEAAGAASVIEHDFQKPAHWQQEWRDKQFRRELWQQLGTPKNEQ